jgi:hypothetical protein
MIQSDLREYLRFSLFKLLLFGSQQISTTMVRSTFLLKKTCYPLINAVISDDMISLQHNFLYACIDIFLYVCMLVQHNRYCSAFNPALSAFGSCFRQREVLPFVCLGFYALRISEWKSACILETMDLLL